MNVCLVGTSVCGLFFTYFSVFYRRFVANQCHQMAIYSEQSVTSKSNTIVHRTPGEYFPLDPNQIGVSTHELSSHAKYCDNDDITGIR